MEAPVLLLDAGERECPIKLKQRSAPFIAVLNHDAGQIRTERGQMVDPIMVNFPLPLMTATLFVGVAVMVWGLELGPRRANVMFAGLLGLCALEAILVGLRFGYGVDQLIPVQRALPLFLGPMIYLSFVSLTVGASRFRRLTLLHLAVPVVILGIFWTVSDGLGRIDWLISGSYLFYLVALYLLWRKGPDALSYAHVEVSRGLSNGILRGAGILVFVLFLDTAIALDFMLNRGAHAAKLISYGSVPLIVFTLAALITIPRMLNSPQAAKPATPSTSGRDAEIEAGLGALMRQDQLYLDPDITVQRLARRLHLPVRTLSAAINREKGKNVSQYVNDFRVEHAAKMLTQGQDSVAIIAAQSGFLSRSNFYREFQRVYGQTPVEFRKSGAPKTAATD
ncbi:helix-turn-helix domain-containing protein [Pseudophaeobacter arcticus]|uniref:helix-turn-helix domain-containing protein n=1 Tax=Pseudophaeobacter arcticus TaxID=385492 RepID=UPI003A97894A